MPTRVCSVTDKLPCTFLHLSPHINTRSMYGAVLDGNLHCVTVQSSFRIDTNLWGKGLWDCSHACSTAGKQHKHRFYGIPVNGDIPDEWHHRKWGIVGVIRVDLLANKMLDKRWTEAYSTTGIKQHQKMSFAKPKRTDQFWGLSTFYSVCFK